MFLIHSDKYALSNLPDIHDSAEVDEPLDIFTSPLPGSVLCFQ